MTQSWQNSDLFTVDTLVNCGAVKVEFFNYNGSAGTAALDADLFK